MEKVACNKCEATFEIQLKEDKKEDGIIVTYFICPSCNHKYIAFVTDEECRQLQQELGKTHIKLRGKEWKKKRKQLKKKMAKLKFKYI
ncbi:hypothetical protein [Virgibacillus halodenitrificans]|uniref:Transglycosylase n=1 Tax=Virgibacillus halodenitrificans TaxID=1482 RepID=A0ABR7VPP2_VIRHA|nr:hypothetical protein [Virgibacillus halodenitrificans]MBD1222767.1 hypothetical protein [Virgibacillus halodenitrificans]